MAMDYKDLGLRVRTLRRQQGMTQEKLAETVGISASFLGHIERGTRVASIDTLVALCNTLNVQSDYLLGASLEGRQSMPKGLTPKERAKLNEFLQLAQETVRQWTDEG